MTAILKMNDNNSCIGVHSRSANLKLSRLLPASAREARCRKYDKLKLNWRSVPEIDPSIPAFVELPHAPFTNYIDIFCSLIWIQRRNDGIFVGVSENKVAAHEV